MKTEVYVVSDPQAIDYIINSDIERFVEYLSEDATLIFKEPDLFDTEEEAVAYCAGLGYGTDERATPARLPLRSSEPADVPFIAAIKGY